MQASKKRVVRSMAGRRRAARGDLNSRLQRLVDDRMGEGTGGAYEALQLLRSQVARAVAASDAPKALETARLGACRLLEHGAVECALPLALEYVKILDDFNLDSDDARAAEALSLAGRFGATAADASEAARKAAGENEQAVLGAALQWSAKVGALTVAHPQLHRRAGELSAARLDLHGVVRHYCLAELPADAVGTILRVCGARKHRELRDAMLCRIVLVFLARENLRDANAAMDALRAADAGAVAGSRPLELAAYLLRTCERDAAPLFRQLCARYEPHLGLVRGAPALLARIGERFFGIRPPPSIMDMMANMFGGGGA